MERLPRSLLREAPYNPRTIDRAARKKLEKHLQGVGLVQPLVYNRTTGNLVSGHQRLAILDELEGSPEYTLDVAVVEVDEARERELVVFLNNQSAMGTWDLEKLETLLATPDLNLKALGFDETELRFLLPDFTPALPPSPPSPGSGAGNVTEMGAEAGTAPERQPDPAAADAEMIRKMKASRKAHKEAGAKADDAEFHFTLVFPDRATRDAFLQHGNLPTGERFVDGVRLATNLGWEL